MNNIEHKYFTRSKNKLSENNENKDNIEDFNNELDEYDNLKDFIDYDCDDDYDEKLLQKEINRLRGNRNYNKEIIDNDNSEKIEEKTAELFLSYVMMNALTNMNNLSPSKSRKKQFIQNKKNEKTLKKPKSKPKQKQKTPETNKNIEKEIQNINENENNLSKLVLELEDETSDSSFEYKSLCDNDSLEEILNKELESDIELDSEEDSEYSEKGSDEEYYDQEDSDCEEESCDDNDSDENDSDEDDSDDFLEDSTFTDNSDNDEKLKRINSESSFFETSDEEYESSFDKYDDEFIDLTTNDIDEDKELEYFTNLGKKEKIKTINQLKEIKNINDTYTPLRFKILNSDMDITSKSLAISNIEKLEEMDVSSDEHYKMNKWINGLIKIPFGKTFNLQVNNDNTIQEKRKYIINTKKTLDEAIYGHKEAKEHILQVIGKWIRNPESQGNVLAIQGPMGNGKTTLVKQGISKAIGRPFAFIALGGATDSSFFDGHSYTYIGSHWGRIIDILMETKCMNPVIYFDELDKVSETYKGDEIIHLLTHLTDPSQNNVFQDNYFPGINIDLSKALFIFSFNDETKINRILKDRMYVINTKGFKVDDKLLIANDYLLPELLETFLFTKDDIIFPDDTLKTIIEKYTSDEEGVRNLKRCLETIISKINIFNLSYDKEKKESIDLDFNLEDFELPYKITNEIAENLLTKKKNDDKPPEHMYM